MRRASFVLAALLAAASPRASRAQGSARSLDLDPSVRAAGMGAASNAVYWDGGNQWANPALLGEQHGLRYEWGKTRLVPGLAADIHFESNVVKMGGSGLGVALSGKPGIGSLKLDYGQSQGTDDQGNPTGTFDSFEHIDSWGFGLSLGQASEGVAKLFGGDLPALSRYGDVSFGMYSKEVEINLGPGPASDAKSSSPSRDWGALVRVSPLEWFAPTRDFLLSLDIAYGWSELSYNGDVDFPGLATIPPSHHQRHGFAVRGALDWPEFAGLLAGAHRPWWAEGLTPMLTVARAHDHDEISPNPYETDGQGYEIGIANVVTFRFGDYQDRSGGIEGHTSGWSVGLPVGQFGGARYDHGRFPQARLSGLPDLTRNAVSAWVDPLEVWSAIRR